MKDRAVEQVREKNLRREGEAAEERTGHQSVGAMTGYIPTEVNIIPETYEYNSCVPAALRVCV